MKNFRIYRYVVSCDEMQNRKREIFTDDVELERSNLSLENDGRKIHLYYEHLNEPYEEEANHSFTPSPNRRGVKCN